MRNELVAESYLGEARSSSVIATAELQRLPDNPCRFVMLCNWNTDDSTALNYSALSGDNLYENAGFEILYGFNGIVAHQLFASQSTGLLPVKNTNLISFRSRTADRALFYTWFY